uniref:J domain-containing protein n=1 Tax=Tanacetum cinerariifolium TaxID=118510 RepID=A0A6L2LL46_TANCI|nr:hypothetical protein [Tanacetum cinerariifolium]
MECNKDEAIRAKNIAENKMKNDDYEGARKIALKAQKLYPQLDNISQLLAVCDVMCSAERKIYGTELDVYGILQVESNADEETIKKQYRKLALALHPDKNQFSGAEAAFKLINEANRILSDKGLRYMHDSKCTPKQNHLPNQKSHAGMQSGARATHSSGVNLNQQSQSGSNGMPTFWTCCPFCMIKYQYYTDVKNKRLKCSKCTRPFTAIDIGAHVQQSAQPPHSSRAGQKNMGRPQQEYVGKQGNVKVDSQSAGSSSHFGSGDAKEGTSRAKTAENGNLNTESGKKGVESKETVSKPSVVSDSNGKRPRKRPQADFTPEKKIKKTKSSDVKDKQKEAESKNDVSEPTASPNAEGSLRKNKNRKKDKLKEEDDILNADSTSESEESEPVYIDCPEPEFSNFDKDKEEGRFAADQFWAIYDTLDGMPRFYAQIKKVFSSPFRLKITWLEADPENPQEIVWAGEGLPVACGRFKRGDTEDTSDRLMFSHQITCEKGSKRSYFVVYPQKGEIWALYRDWDFNWSSDPESHKKYKYEIVEVLSDFDKENGVLVAYMVKLEGFVSLFQKTGRARLAEHRILSGELFRFSHRIPSTKMTGKERADVPVGSCELDTASLPDDLNEYFFSNNVKPNPKNVSTTDASCPQSPGRKVNDSEKGTCNVRRSPRGSQGNLEISNGTSSESNLDSSSKADDLAGQDNAVNVSSTRGPELSSPPSGGNEALVIHDFHLDKQKWKFQEGQIWALNIGRYAQVKMIESSPIRLHVDLLELCSDAIRPNACGLYRASKGGRQVVQQDSFLYLVHAEVNGKNRFNIYPREKEVWVLNNKDDTKGTLSHVDVGDCDIVEVLENNGDMIRVLSLSRVPGYKSVFRALEIQNSKEKKVLEIPLADSNRFYCRVPAFLLTVEHDGRLEGSWELDFAVFPGLLLI